MKTFRCKRLGTNSLLENGVAGGDNAGVPGSLKGVW